MYYVLKAILMDIYSWINVFRNEKIGRILVENSAYEWNWIIRKITSENSLLIIVIICHYSQKKSYPFVF